MDELKGSLISISTSTKIDIDEYGTPFDIKWYHDIISSLFYLIASRPNILFSIYLHSHFQLSSQKSYFKALKRIFKYLKDTSAIG